MSVACQSGELTPLFVAVAELFRSVPSARELSGGPARDESHLDVLADAVASLAPVIVYSQDGRSLRTLTDEELDEGSFRQGGRAFCFFDGRPDVTNLAVRARDLAPLIASMERKAAV